MTGIERISGAKGSQLVTGTTAVTRTFNCFSVNEDAEISELYTSDALTTNLVTELGLSSKTLKAGQVFFCEQSKEFGKIKLASGSVIIH